MNKIVTVHSFRQSVGKSTLAANLAVVLALQGRRVGLVDTDFQGASAHLFFGLREEEIKSTLNDYLLKQTGILNTAHDLTDRLGPQARGKLFLVPASAQISDIMKMLRTSIKIERYTAGLATLEKELDLDIVLVDTRAGLNENTLTALAVSQALILVLHPDPQDFQGTAVTVDVARKMPVHPIHLVLNDSSEALDPQEVSRQLEETYHCGGGFVLSHSDDLAALASGQPFVLAYPNHPLTARITEIANHLM